MRWMASTKVWSLTLPLIAAFAAEARAVAPGARVEREPWRLDPMAVILLLLLLAWYVRGAWQARGPRGVVGREESAPVPVARRIIARWGETLCFLSGWTVLAFAFFSPLDTMANALFSAHVLQHELMLQLAVPLMVLGRPRSALLQALPPDWSREVQWRIEESRTRGLMETLSHPWAACSLHAVLLWFWHLPGPFDAAMRHGTVHGLQHFSLVGSAVLLWWSLLYGPDRPARRSSVLLFLFTTALHRLTLGALIVCSGRLWYSSYLHTPPAWGFAPIEDLQLGAVLLWVPAGIAAILLTLALFTGWLRIPAARLRPQSSLVRMTTPVVPARPDTGAWQH